MQMIGIHTIEDCLEIITGLQKHNLEFKIDNSDATIINSVARQVFKGVALTDRQYNLMKEKLLKYKQQFDSQDVIGFERAIEKLRNPVRYIDRSKYIKIIDHPDEDIVYNSDVFNGKFIKIRFPFKKSDIMLINEITNTNTYLHKKGSHSHFFLFNEINVIKILDRFLNKEFEIDDDIKEVYQKAKQIQKNPNEYLSGIEDFELVNINPTLLDIIKKEVGNKITEDNVIKLIDRKFRYGLGLYNTKTPASLTERIAYRSETGFLCKPSDYSLDNVLSALWSLDRFPMLVVLDKTRCEEQLYEIVSYYRDILPNECQSVLFRVEESSAGFNQLVRDRKLNNWVDKDTKIVYISSDKLPKVLLNAEWSPVAAFSFNSRHDRNVEQYVSNRCDLVVYREEELSPIRRYSQYYG